jgi:hypothetical protein
MNVAAINGSTRLAEEKRDAPVNELLRQQRLQGDLTREQSKQAMQDAKDMSVLNPTYSVQNLGDGRYATIRNDPNLEFNPPSLAPQKSIAEVLQERENNQIKQMEKEQERTDKFLPVQTTNSETGQITTRQTLKNDVQSQNENYMKALEDIASSDEATTETGKSFLKKYFPEKYARLFPKG